jgi:hypothetical protein
MHNPVSIVNAGFSKRGHFGNVHVVALLFSNFSFYPFLTPVLCFTSELTFALFRLW